MGGRGGRLLRGDSQGQVHSQGLVKTPESKGGWDAKEDKKGVLWRNSHHSDLVSPWARLSVMHLTPDTPLSKSRAKLIALMHIQVQMRPG